MAIRQTISTTVYKISGVIKVAYSTTVYKISGVIKVACPPVVTEDFLTKAVRSHFQGRLALTGVTTIVVLLIIPKHCPGGANLTFIAALWTIASFFLICGARPYEKEEGVNIDVGSLMGVHYRRWSKYPWWTFIPDVLILTAIVIHSGAAFSLFIPMFLVLGTLGDHTLIAWPWRRLFLPLFIFVPYTFVILVSTPIGKALMLNPYLQRISHEEFWAPLEPISYRVAICTWVIFVGATLLTSYVLRHLLLIGIEANIRIETTTSETNVTAND
jgi:hypothetical protein